MNQDREPTRFIISDLHLGQNDDFDIFKAVGKEEAFDAFLKFCASQEGPVELVINGDFVDFLQLKPWDAYAKPSAAKDIAVEKARAIAAGHARVFKALGTFLSDPKHRLVVLLGNHDVELAYDEVWAIIRDAIIGSTPAKGILEFKSRVTQYNFTVDGVRVHVQHGNIGDPWNEILYRELFDNAEKNSGFKHPPGTLLVYEIMNDFKERFRFVDMLKPEIPAVPLLLARLEPSGAAQLPKATLAYLRSLKSGFVGRLRRWLGGGNFGPKSSVKSERQRTHVAMAQAYIAQVGARTQALSNLDVNHLLEFLNEPQFEAKRSEGPAFGRRWEAVQTNFVRAPRRPSCA
jgi:UDP-2,3-diacylglucosamine pyrophosphatase LpxH